MRIVGLIFIMLTVMPTAVSAQEPVDLAAARASLTGNWEGSLEYLDYGANKWFGIPVETRIEDQGDGATVIRRSDFDDGPTVGNVRITTVEFFDDSKGTLSVGTFRKGREPEISVYAVRLDGVAQDATHWTMLEEVDAKDDDRPAKLRLTTVRDGDQIETLKQVDFLDDDKTEWITRNRTRLKKLAG